MIAAIAFALSAMVGPANQAEPAEVDPPTQSRAQGNKPQIIVQPQKSEGDRREELREFTRKIVREPRRKRAIASFRFPICPQVIGIAAEDARAIEARIRENAERVGLGADDEAKCTPTIRAAFMAAQAGPPESWLDEGSPQLAHLPLYQRHWVLTEEGPVRAYNRVVLRDAWGQPLLFSKGNARVFGALDQISELRPFSTSDPINVNEITGAAVMIELEAAQGLSLAQLADYITMRTLLATSVPEPGEPVAAATILTLFQSDNPPEALTVYDLALLDELYNASLFSSPRRVIARTAAQTTKIERSGEE
ncbi:hypothetical protein [Erythrobacter sp. YT30]|uniref:hypothetical protein n=1 Tax=Erythrobacter sp. YT30 TaxID=1735012 RepID=UPI00076DEDA4|nr:hypothetical protein [Erythrobacter sp. YT30]KWV93369.1 hypothetical protein AUC45_04500 [Erythrobacter sp. YT30]